MKHLITIFASLPMMLSFNACSSDDDEDISKEDAYNQTIFMYMPWSGDDIYPYFRKNIETFETAIENNKGTNNANRVLRLWRLCSSFG